MSDARFDIIFRGDILPGHQLASVKERLKQLFKADDTRIDALFSGGVTPLKRNLDKDSADKYQAVLSKAGAEIQIAPAGKVQARQAPQRAAVAVTPAVAAPQKAVVAAAVSPPPAKKLSLKERLEAQASELARQEAETRQAEEASAAFSLAPVGSNLLDTAERPKLQAVQVDTSALSLRPAEGELLDTSEKATLVMVAVDTSALSVDELGADLLAEAEKHQQPDVEVDTSMMGLAPAGSDMGQLKVNKPLLNPDTSGLSLSE